MSSPLEQFEIKPIVGLYVKGYDISFSNSALAMVISSAAIILIFALLLRKRSIIPNLAQSVPEALYEFIYNLIKSSTGKAGLKYFSFIFCLFLYIAVGNVFGLFPYSFTFTSHIAAVGALSILALIFNMIVGIRARKLGYLRTFLPKGIPYALAPLVVPIEMISLLSKPFSLTVRLVANMTVGHIMLKILGGFVVGLGLFGFVPIVFQALIIIFELFIAVLQAFIYTVLSCIYLGDALRAH
ncbi:MAG: F0F1 ATP synthase subunit A [Alphaproteobacteria bacterium]|nr:F0F1 ATP synthase subunit A [Alphaproteobacteria bacterium]